MRYVGSLPLRLPQPHFLLQMLAKTVLGSLRLALDSLQVGRVSDHYGLDHKQGYGEVGGLGHRPLARY